MSKANERREKIVKILMESSRPVNGTELAKLFNVSRQVVVSDIAILKETNKIISTNRGYTILKSKPHSRVFKVQHDDSDIMRELNAIVDRGAIIKDVFISHRLYGKISIDLDIRSRRDAEKLVNVMGKSISLPLNNLTEGYHYHTVEADSEEILDEVEEELRNLGFLIEKR